jgi:hypothetical protein
MVMSIDREDPFQKIEELFRAGKPSESQKRQRRPSKRALIGRLLPDIERLLAEGYSFVGISAYFVDLGLQMPVSTLKNYVTRARRDHTRTSGKGPSRTSRGASNLQQQMRRRATAPSTKRDSARAQTPRTAEAASEVVAPRENQWTQQPSAPTLAKIQGSQGSRMRSAGAEEETATTDGAANADASRQVSDARHRPVAAGSTSTQGPLTKSGPQTLSTGTGWVPRNR